MIIKGLIDEDFTNYYKTSMFIIFPYCDLKCDKESGQPICQNSLLVRAKELKVRKETICERYIKNPISKAVVCGGLEPLDSELDLLAFIDCLRRVYNCKDDIVIYTGYTEEEVEKGNFGNADSKTQRSWYRALKEYPNIIMKFGRFIPNQESVYDKVLGVELASPNQYGKVISNES